MLKLIKEYKLFRQQSFWSVMLFLLCILPSFISEFMDIYSQFSSLLFISGIFLFIILNRFLLKSTYGYTEILTGYLKIVDRLLTYLRFFTLFIVLPIFIILVLLIKFNIV